MDGFYHEPIMVQEAVCMLAIRSNGVYVDGTVGGGGHASAILHLLGKNGRLLACDRDQKAVEAAYEVLTRQNSEANFCVCQKRFSDMKDWLGHMGISSVDGILLDIGLSSHQIDTPQRGFSYMKDGPLDMRMDRSAHECSAYTLVNESTPEQLGSWLRDYGEERWWRRITDAIVLHRRKKPIRTTQELVAIIERAVPRAKAYDGGHPAKRTFQALRIAVNDELRELQSFLDQLPFIMNQNARVVIISFHSLEDRIVKQAFRAYQDGCVCPKTLPICVCGKKPQGKVLTKKPRVPTKEEVARNPRSAGAKMRAFHWNPSM